MLDHYRMFAAYNAWANRVLYEEVGKLDDADYRRNLGAFFGSLHGTLNHLLAADRIWMRRFTGEGEAPASLDTILHEDFAGLRAVRQAEDARHLAKRAAEQGGPRLVRSRHRLSSLRVGHAPFGAGPGGSMPNAPISWKCITTIAGPSRERTVPLTPPFSGSPPPPCERRR